LSNLSHAPFLAGWRYRALIYSVVLSALGYLGFALFGGWREVTSALVQVGVTGLLLALLLSLVNYGLRYLRWHLYLSTLGHRIPWRPGFQIYLAGFALTTTPGKAGEAFRGLLLKRRDVPYPDSFAAFFSERLSDLIAIVLLTLLGLSLYPQAWPLILLGGLLCLGLLAMLAGALSFTPGGLGSTEGVMAALLIRHGVAAPEAIAATVLIRSTTLWFAVGLGVAALATTAAADPPRENRIEEE
jgi:uncharacterized membrane protein YbhN (UPF0104 family)